jgi:hypothetical protein
MINLKYQLNHLCLKCHSPLINRRHLLYLMYLNYPMYLMYLKFETLLKLPLLLKYHLIH